MVLMKWKGKWCERVVDLRQKRKESLVAMVVKMLVRLLIWVNLSTIWWLTKSEQTLKSQSYGNLITAKPLEHHLMVE